MAIVYDIDLESGDKSELAGEFGGTGVTATAASALAGTNYGLSVVVDDTGDYVYPAVLDPVNTTGVYRVRFYLDPNSITMADGDQVDIFILRGSAQNLMALSLCRGAASYSLAAIIFNDAGAYTGLATNPTLTDAPHYIEFLIQRATNSGSSNGYLSVYLDGSLDETISGIDNYDRMVSINGVRIGNCYCADGGGTTTGTFFMDQFVVNDDGSEIGPLGATLQIAITPDSVSAVGVRIY